MTEREYRSAPGISRSQLWRLHDSSPEKFKWWLDHPEEPTPALIFGQAVHKMLLEPDGFDEAFIVSPGFDRRTKEGKAAYAAFCAAKGDRTEIGPADYETIKAIVEKARSTPFVSRLLQGEREKPIFWTDELTGERCKARLDCLTELGEEMLIIDYKSTADASETAFMKSVINYGYDFQTAHYTEAVKSITDKPSRFIFIAQEKTAPYAVNIFEAEPLMVRRGYDIFRETLGLYHECRESGNWYGYLGKDEHINMLPLPAWAAKELS